MRIYTSTILVQIYDYIFFLLGDRLWCLTIILHRIFIDIRFFGQKLGFYEVVDKIFKLERTRWSSNIFICYLILSFFGVVISIFVRGSIIFLRNLSLNWSEMFILLNLFRWLDLSFKIHLISIHRGILFWIGKIFRLKRRMMNDDRASFLLCFYIRSDLIWINRLRGHLHYLIFLWWLFWISIDVYTVYVLLYFLDNIWILIQIFSTISKIFFI